MWRIYRFCLQNGLTLSATKGIVMRKNHAFTLVELLVVIGIIAVLIAMLLPALNKARKAAINVQCLSNIRQIATAALMYAGENKGILPGALEDSQHGISMMALRTTASDTMGVGVPPAAVPTGQGLLYQKGFLKTSALHRCPGRSDTTDIYQLTGSNLYYGKAQWDAWVASGTVGQVHTAYVMVNSNMCSVYRGNPTYNYFFSYHKWGQTGRRGDSDKPMVFDWPWLNEGTPAGASQTGHGKGINMAFFDGSARFVPDKNNLCEALNSTNSPSRITLFLTLQILLGWDAGRFDQSFPVVNPTPFP